ncbi:MAG: formylglycine-generating enzyme family protein [Armatimonadota bacterium]
MKSVIRSSGFTMMIAILCLSPIMTGYASAKGIKPKAVSKKKVVVPASGISPKSWKMKINTIDGAEMMWVPAGKFLQGQYLDFRSVQAPRRSVYLDGFWIYKNEVTVVQYRTFCQATYRAMPEAPKEGWQDIYPITGVNWQDAADYAAWAQVSLPTEAQWEKAARGTDGREYPWGNSWDITKCVNYQNSTTGIEPVGSYPTGVSPYGCMDMAGNAWEWCSDWYDANYYHVAPSKNPKGPSSGSMRAMRGGAWFNFALRDYDFRCAYRFGFNPAAHEFNYGFRCASGK